MTKDDIFIHIINYPYTVCMKSYGRVLHPYGLISCMLAVDCSKKIITENTHRISYGFLSIYFSLK